MSLPPYDYDDLFVVDEPEVEPEEEPWWQTAPNPLCMARESGRRRALFARAGKKLEAMAMAAGDHTGGEAFVYSLTRAGLPARLGVRLNADLDLVWSPRDGFYTVKVDDLPF